MSRHEWLLKLHLFDTISKEYKHRLVICRLCSFLEDFKNKKCKKLTINQGK